MRNQKPMLLGDFAEDNETMLSFQVPQMPGHNVNALYLGDQKRHRI